jgi:hypothetical protein
MEADCQLGEVTRLVKRVVSTIPVTKSQLRDKCYLTAIAPQTSSLRRAVHPR